MSGSIDVFTTALGLGFGTAFGLALGTASAILRWARPQDRGVFRVFGVFGVFRVRPERKAADAA